MRWLLFAISALLTLMSAYVLVAGFWYSDHLLVDSISAGIKVLVFGFTTLYIGLKWDER